MSTLHQEDDFHENDSAEALQSAQKTIIRTVFAIIDRHFGYPNPPFTSWELAKSLLRMGNIPFGMKCASLHVEMAGRDKEEFVAVIGLTLCRENEEDLPLQIYCPLFPDPDSLNTVPIVHVNRQNISPEDRGPGKKERAIALIREAADAVHNLHITDTVNDRAKTGHALAPVQKALQEINEYLRKTLDFEEREEE